MISLTPGKRVLFLTKDPELIRRQLRGELDLRMDDLRVEELMDDINSRMRWLLVEAAWRVATHRQRPETQALREWTERIARRRGQRVAVVALARKLSGILYAMWRDGSAYDPGKLKGMRRSEVEKVA